MAHSIKVTDPERVSYRVRVIRNGYLVSTVYMDTYEAASEYALTELWDRTTAESALLWAAVVESGIRFEGLGTEKTLFAYNGQLREGVVLNKELLATVDRKFLFGLR